jgi:hypothetical protein
MGTIALTINFYNGNTLVILEADTLFNDVDFVERLATTW